MALRDILAKFGVKVDTKQLLGFDKKLGGAIGRLKQLGAVIGGSVLLGQIKTFTTELINQGDEIGKTAKRLNLTTDQLQGWQHATGLAGIKSKEFELAVKSLNKNAFEAGVNKSSTYVKAFDRLGVSVTDGKGNLKGFEELFLDTGEAIGAMSSETERSALATTLLGRSGIKLIPFFKQGREGIKAARGELKKYGGGLSKDAVEKLEKAQDALARFDLGLLSLKGRLASVAGPAITRVAEGLAEFSGNVSEAIEGTDIIEASLLAAAVAAGIFGKGMLLAFVKALPVIGLVVIAVLLLEDAIGTLRGKDSVIKDVFDAFAGAGSTERQVNRLNDAVDKLFEKDFSGFFGEVSDIMASFGEDIVDHIIMPVKGLGQQLEDAIEDGMIDAGKSAALSIADWQDQLASEIRGLATTLATEMGELATAMIDGFVDSWKDNAIITTVVDTVKAAIGGANKEAEVKSPSRKMNRFGRFLMQGATLGAEAEGVNFQRAVVSSVSRTINVVGARVNQTNQVSQTITGVSDPRAAGDRAGSRIVGTAQAGFESAYAALVTVG